MEIASQVLAFLLPVLASVLTLVLIALAKKGLDKMGVERSEKIDTMIDTYVEKGVLVAERAGAAYLVANGSKLTSMTKKSKAIQVVFAELEQSGLKDVGAQLISARIEAFLEGKDPKEPTGEAA